MITKDTIDRIFDAILIEDVIGEFVHLKKSGSNLKGKSPFTDEKTPSFFVSPAKGIYKCFSTGKGGNAISFLMEAEKMTYPEALKWAANKFGIEVVEEKVSEEQQEVQNDRESLGVITAFAEKHFMNTLYENDEGRAIGLSYLYERGFREDIIKKFKLGYSLDKWDAFTKTALTKGYKLKYLLDSGLSKDREGAPFDFFKGRVMFPIHNVSGKPIGFGGRTLRNDKKTAKYFNSPENDLYHKSNVLYGLYFAKNSIIKKDECFLVEGYTDVISLHQKEVENVVSSSGTSLTDGQIKLIKRYTQNITVLFDGDAAGIKAAFRGIDLLLKAGMNIKVVLFPEGEDPDSYSKKLSSEELNKFLKEEAKDFMVFKTDLLLGETAGDPIKRAGLIREIVTSISLIPDAIKRSIYLKECSTLMDIEEGILISEINKILRTNLNKGSRGQDHGRTQNQYPNQNNYQGGPPPNMPPASGVPNIQEPAKLSSVQQEKDFIRILLTYGDHIIRFETEEDSGEFIETSVSEFLIQELAVDKIELKDKDCAAVIEEYEIALKTNEFLKPRDLIKHESLSVSSLCADLLSVPDELSENWSEIHQVYPETEEMHLKKAVKDVIFRLKLKHIRILAEDIQEKIKAGPSGDEELMMLLGKKKHLDVIKIKLTQDYGTTIIS